MYSSTLLIPGTQKAGTSTLHGLLTSRSQISPLLSDVQGNIKKPHFFSLVPEKVEEEFERYRSLLSTDTEYVIDSSTLYLMAPGMPQLARDSSPESKATVILRDPVRCAFLRYLQMVKKMLAQEKRDFSNIVEALHGLRLTVEIAKAENQMLEKAIQRGVVDASYFGTSYLQDRLGVSFCSTFQDPLLPYKHFQHNCCSERLRDLHKAFGEDLKLKLICLERLSSEMNNVATEVFPFSQYSQFLCCAQCPK